MRDHSRSRPEVEPIESKVLLSGAAGMLHTHALLSVHAIAPVATRTIHLVGMAKGTYHARYIPDAGKTYTFTGTGAISPLGQTSVTGTVELPGLLIMPIIPIVPGGSPVTTPPPVQAFGTLTLASPPGGTGTLTLKVSGPSFDNATVLPRALSFTIIGATGQFQGDTGSGWLVIGVTPAKPAATGGTVIGGQEQGSFTMTFLQFPPPVTTP